MDIGLSVQQATGQVNVSPFAGLVNKRQFKYAGSCDETRLSVHRSKNHVRLPTIGLTQELFKLLIVHLSDPPIAKRLSAFGRGLPALKPNSSALFSRHATSLVSPLSRQTLNNSLDLPRLLTEVLDWSLS